ncbi:MAG TPA: phenylalanine--tRNA ligase subunit alpha [Candidatus Thermoplasmatota archaeon]
MAPPATDKVEDIKAKLSAGERKLLLALAPLKEASVEHLLVKGGFDQVVEVMNSASWAKAKGLVTLTENVYEVATIAQGGKRAIAAGLPERRALAWLLKRGGAAPAPQLVEHRAVAEEELTIALGWLKRKGWAQFSKVGGETVLEVTPAGRAAAEAPTADEEVLRAVEHRERRVSDLPEDGVSALRRRQDLVKVTDRIERRIRISDLGAAVVASGLTADAGVGQLTHEMLVTGKWRDLSFRPYDVTAFAPVATGGRPHPLREMLDEARAIFLAMGFTEIDDDYVQSAFWNMDALFIPQDHPAREIQDTFYLKEPATVPLPDEALVARVKAAHEDGGGTGSTGWGGAWSRAAAEQALLRTHTTAATIRHLAAHPHSPQKVFAVSRCFRREAVDATHLPEFHQIEGIVVEPTASLAMLKGTLTAFYRRLGFPKVRLLPSYFPYTEPSMEVQVWYEGKWLELGGSGVFRPEVTAPLSVKDNVIAWGHGLERLAMVRFGLKDIRDLYLSDLDWLRKRPLLP